MLVEDNRPALFDDIQLLNLDAAAEFATLEKGLGRIENHRCRAILLNGAPDELVALPSTSPARSTSPASSRAARKPANTAPKLRKSAHPQARLLP